VLHVVWEGGAAVDHVPTLVLRDALDAPIEELEHWVGGAGELPMAWLEGRCAAPLRRLAAAEAEELLRQAARVRLETRQRRFRARARAAGWRQALWEGLFRALGYKHNAWPMQRIAESLPQAVATVEGEGSAASREAWEARLLGLSGV